MILGNLLITFPVHRRSYEAYYAAHEKYISAQKRLIEIQWGKPFDSLEKKVQDQWENDLWWPPWYSNDIIGFLEIGSDGGRCLVGEIHLRRKHLPRNSLQRQRYRQASQTKDIVYYGETGKYEVGEADNSSFLRAVEKIVSEARTTLKKRIRNSQITLPGFELSCIDFVEAYKQIKRK